MWRSSTLLTILLILWNVLCGSSIILFYLHRDVPSIAFRTPCIALVQAAVLALMVNFYLLRTFVVGMPCFVMLWANSLAIPLFLFLFFIRYIWLAKEYWRSALQMAIHDREYEEKKHFLDSEDAQRHSHSVWDLNIPKLPPGEAEKTAMRKVAICEFFDPAFIRNSVLVFFAIQVTTLVSILVMSDHFKWGVTKCTPAAAEYIPLFVWSAATLAIAPLAMYVMLGVKENYGICTELDITTGIIFTTFVAISTSTFLYYKSKLVRDIRSTVSPLFMVIGTLIVVFIVSVAYPAFAACISEISRLRNLDVESQQSSGNNGTEKPGLNEFDSSLRNPEIMSKFRRFSIKDFSTENVIFYEKWMRAKEIAESGGYWQVLYIKIYNDFLVNDAPMELNVTAPLLKEAHKEFAKKDEYGNPTFGKDVLDKVATEVLKLMYENTYTRFIRGK